METMKDKLVKLALEWEDKFGVAPRITASISEYDAAMVTGMTEDEYSQEMQDKTAVGEGYDFEYNKLKYQVKGSRPSKKREKEHPKDPVTKVGKAAIEYKDVSKPWDKLIWVLYDKKFEPQGAWEWDFDDYKREITPLEYVRPGHMKRGKQIIFPKIT